MQQLLWSRYPGIFRKFQALSLMAGDERPVSQVLRWVPNPLQKPDRLKVLRGRRGAIGAKAIATIPMRP